MTIVERVLGAAQHEQRVMMGGAVRQVGAALRRHDVELGAGGGERIADLAGAGVVIVLDDENAHGWAS